MPLADVALRVGARVLSEELVNDFRVAVVAQLVTFPLLESQNLEFLEVEALKLKLASWRILMGINRDFRKSTVVGMSFFIACWITYCEFDKMV